MVQFIDFQVYKKISNQIRTFYFNGDHMNRQTLPQMNKLMSDIQILYGLDLSARIQAVKSNGRTIFARYYKSNS